MSGPRILVASNRGPVSFAVDEGGEVHTTRGAGGVVAALTGAVARAGMESATGWIAAAMTDGDRAATASGPFELTVDGLQLALRYLSVDPETYEGFYNGISNRVLWFAHHGLWDTVSTPSFDESTLEAWDAYRLVNRAFAAALAAEAASGTGAHAEAAFLVQDYHLSLVPAMLRAAIPAARIAHFSHTPFAAPRTFGMLPRPIGEELLGGLLGADVLGFNADPWAEAFLLTCRTIPGAAVDLRRRRVRWQDREVRIRVHPIGIDAPALGATARTPEVRSAERELARATGDMKLIVGVDRMEPTKNIRRGFDAFGSFLRGHPEWRRRVRFLALLNPSRRGLPEYRAYAESCLAAADRVNDAFGEDGWRPIEARVRDDLPAAVAAYRRYDVLMVNPTIDGMNLVAKEGPSLNRRGGALVLSQNAGAVAELGRHALVVNPFDVGETAEAIHAALEMPQEERARRARGLRRAATRTRPDDWLRAQLEDLGRWGPATESPRSPRPG